MKSFLSKVIDFFFEPIFFKDGDTEYLAEFVKLLEEQQQKENK